MSNPESPSQLSQPENVDETAIAVQADQMEDLTQPQTIFDVFKSLMPTLGISSGISLIIGAVLFGSGASLTTIVGVIVAIFCVIFSYQYPRQALWFFIIYMPFSGTVSYWIGNDHFTFHIAKDGFYIPALIALFIHLKRKHLPIIIPKILKIPLMFWVGVSLVTLIAVNGVQQFSADPQGQPLTMGLIGLKVLIGYIPLITCAYYLIRNRQDFYFFTRLQIVIIITCCVLGLIQFWLVISGYCPDNTGLPDHLLLRANVQRKCLVGGALGYFPDSGFIRLPGTFVAPWNWAWFLISSSFFSFATAFSDTAVFWRMSGLVSLALVMLNAIICGQRTALLAVPAIFALLLIATSHFSRLKRLLIVFIGIGIFITSISILFPNLIAERVDSFIGRWNASPPPEFIVKQAEYSARQHQGILGNGLGRATNSARGLGRTRLIETYYSKLLYETGLIGIVAFLSVVTTITVCSFRSYHLVKNHSLWGYGIVFWVFITLISYNPYWYPLDTDPVAVYYWFVAGILFKLPKIEQQESSNLEEDGKLKQRL